MNADATQDVEAEEEGEYELDIDELWKNLPFLKDDMRDGITTAFELDEVEQFTRGKNALLIACWDAPAWVQKRLSVGGGCTVDSPHAHTVKRSKAELDGLVGVWLGKSIPWEVGCFNVLYILEDDVLLVPLEEATIKAYFREGKD